MRRSGVRSPSAPPIKSTSYGEALLAVFVSVAKPLPKISVRGESVNELTIIELDASLLLKLGALSNIVTKVARRWVRRFSRQ